MNIPKHFSLVKEHPASYEIHDSRDNNKFHVAKSGLNLGMHTKLATIPTFSDGGEQPEQINYDKLIPQEAAQNAPYGTNPVPADAASNPLPTSPGVQVADAMPSMPSSSGAPKDQSSQLNDAQTGGIGTLQTQLKDALKSQQESAAGTANALKDYSTQLQARQAPADQLMLEHKKSNEAALKAFKDKTIDPDHYWSTKNVGGKIGAALGMILGGVGGGVNPVTENINNQIAQDIQLQKDDKSSKLNLYKMNLEATQNDRDAETQTRNQLLTAVQAKAQMFAAQSGGSEAILKFAPLIQSLEMQKMQGTIQQSLANGSPSNMDPSQLAAAFITGPEKEGAFKEIANAQEVKKLQSDMEDSAAHLNGKFMSGALSPNDTNSAKQIFAGKIQKLSEGRYNADASQKLVESMLPQYTDNGDTAQNKAVRRAQFFKTFVQSPIMDGHRFPLSKFNSTSISGPTQSGPHPYEGMTASDSKGNRIVYQNGWKKIGG